MKRVNIYLDEECLAILEQHKAWGKSFAFTVRKALKKYERARTSYKQPDQWDGIDVIQRDE